MDDPGRYVRGNHWGTPPQHPTELVFDANSNSATLNLHVPDDQRDMADGSFKVFVVPSLDYIIGWSTSGEGRTLFRQVNVTDKDTVQQL